MNLPSLVDRARADFIEMPRLELTLLQAARLWSVGVDDCRLAIDALVASGFVTWTARSTVVRTSRCPGGLQTHIDVPTASKQNKSV